MYGYLADESIIQTSDISFQNWDHPRINTTLDLLG